MIVLTYTAAAVICALFALVGAIIGYALCMGDSGSLTRQDGAR